MTIERSGAAIGRIARGLASRTREAGMFEKQGKRSGMANRRLGLGGYFGLVTAVLLLVTGVTLCGLGYRLMTRTLDATVERQVDALGRDIKMDVISQIRQPAWSFLAMFSQGPVPQARTPEERTEYLPLLQAALLANPLFTSIFLGFENGDFTMVRLLIKDKDRRDFQGPPGSAFMVREVRRTGLSIRDEYFYYDEALRPLGRRMAETRSDFDPRTSDWYIEARRSSGQVETGPALLHQPGTMGVLFTQVSRGGRSVAGVAIRLDNLSQMLSSELPTPGARLVMFRPDGTPLASAWGLISGGNGHWRLHSLKDLSPVIQQGVDQYLRGHRTTDLRIGNGAPSTGIQVEVDGQDWMLVLEELDSTAKNDDFLVLAIPRDELYTQSNLFLRQFLMGLAGFLLLTLVVVGLAARQVTTPLRRMARRARRVQEMNFGGKETSLGGKEPRRSYLAEVDDLTDAFDNMLEYMKKTFDIIGAVGTDRDMPRLMGKVLQETVPMAKVEGGGLILLDEQASSPFQAKEALTYWSGQEVKVVPAPSSGLVDPDFKTLIDRALRERLAVTGAVRRHAHPHGPLLAPAFASPDTERVTVALVALRSRRDEPLGLMAFVSPARSGEAAEFLPGQLAIMETLAGIAAIVLETRDLIQNQRDLLDALIQIMAGAIDAKSPYTGGHCARVPVIFQMLLTAAHTAEDGPLKDFHLDEDGWEEARLAAWLHDCGKVTTPEYVVDKATKLETIYNRIHEIRTRFEVLKRDAEIAALRAAQAGADPEEVRRTLTETWRTLDGEFAFVAGCNLGGRNLTDEDLARLETIGRRTWTRTLDRRPGLSRDELARLDRTGGAPAPPVSESLLMDNPEHIIERGPEDFPPPDQTWGFRLKIPEALYNRGELYNLMVRKGTLTEEERYKINDHITRTIMMLTAIPLPPNLRRIPELAGSHHETMDGRGYPRGLKGEEMSWGARMMAIADIFEALTACDRPYKPSHTLRQALDIMNGLVENGHIDPDIYQLFLQADIPRRYAAEHLRPEQNDI